MREKKEYMVITFATTTQAMAMESQCGQEGIPGRLIPVPREITAGCGLAWRILLKDYEENKDRLEALPIPFENQTSLFL